MDWGIEVKANRLMPLWAALMIASAHAAAPYEERMGSRDGWHPLPFESRNDGTAAYETGRFASALRLLRPYAEGGDADAQFRLGSILGGLGEMGVGRERVPKDSAAAATWLGRAAQEGNLAAMREFARLSEQGEGVPKNSVIAFTYYVKAAEKLPEGAAKAAALYDAVRLKGDVLRFIAQFPEGDREAKSLADAVARTEALGKAARPEGVSGVARPDLRR